MLCCICIRKWGLKYFILIGGCFRIGPTGNGTCELSIPLPKYPPDEDPDYDLFIRVLQCRNMTSEYLMRNFHILEDLDEGQGFLKGGLAFAPAFTCLEVCS